MWMRTIRTRRVGALLAVVVLAVTAASLAVASLALAGQAPGVSGQRSAVAGRPAARGRAAHQVKITLDRAGIPHIVARNFTALGYGEGYEFASDNLCTFANDIVTLEGERSRYFGPRRLAVNYSAGSVQTNLESDLYWRYVRTLRIVRRELREPPPNGLIPQVRQIYMGFIAGYNTYLRSGKLQDPTCKGKPWVRPITMTDMLLRGYQIVTEASSSQFISDMVAATVPGARASSLARSIRRAGQSRRASGAQRFGLSVASLRALRGRFSSAAREQGSNGVGLGARDTRAGTGMLLANPHFPWRGTERFWMAQLDVPGQYDVEGGTLEGFPLIGIGFNRNIAWTHTVSTDMRFVAYQLKLVPGHPTRYYVGRRQYRMHPTTVSVRFRGRTARHTFYATRWGTVASVSAAGFYWTRHTAYAIDDFTASAGARAANQYFHMGRASSVHALYDVEAKYLAIPTFNTIAADDRGNAYYGDIGATPAVSAAKIKACMPAGAPHFIYLVAGVVTLDGARAACAPTNTKGTPERGIFPAKDLPHLFRRDYVENSNDSFWLANPSHPLTGFSPIIGRVDVPQNGRTRLANAMIAARVAGTDGLGAPKFTLPTLQAMWESDRSELAEQVLPLLITDCLNHPDQTASNGQAVNLAAACQALAHYNGTGQLGATGGWLFTVWAYLDTDLSFYATPFSASAPLTTPAGLNTTSATPLVWLADAVQNLRAHHVALDATIGDVQHAPQSRKISLPGCFGESSAQDMGCFNAIYSPAGTPATSGPVNGGPYGQVNDGSSLVMTTQLNRSGPVSEGILTYSQASDPRSRWYANMTRLYAAGRWVKLPYTASQLKADHPFKTFTLKAP